LVLTGNNTYTGGTTIGGANTYSGGTIINTVDLSVPPR
jgi:Passenger-associated-transport-repeat